MATMFARHRQGDTVRLAVDPVNLEPCDRHHAGRLGTVEHVWFDYYTLQWAYQVRVPGDLVVTYEDGLEVANDLSA